MTIDLLKPVCRLTITLQNGTLWRRKPLYVEIVGRAKSFGLAGASVFRAIEGFSLGGPIRTSRFLSLGDQLPLSIVLTDDEEKLLGFLASLEADMECDSIVLDHVHQYSPNPYKESERTCPPPSPTS
jgi:PII-like signaling protein